MIKGFVRHASILAERGSFDRGDVKVANALRLIKKEIKRIERRIRDVED